MQTQGEEKQEKEERYIMEYPSAVNVYGSITLNNKFYQYVFKPSLQTERVCLSLDEDLAGHATKGELGK